MALLFSVLSFYDEVTKEVEVSTSFINPFLEFLKMLAGSTHFELSV
jgi:hypothetical protein